MIGVNGDHEGPGCLRKENTEHRHVTVANSPKKAIHFLLITAVFGLISLFHEWQGAIEETRCVTSNENTVTDHVSTQARSFGRHNLKT